MTKTTAATAVGRLRLLVPLARAGYGAALLCAPGPMIGIVTGKPPSRRARQVARVLGVRHLAQAAVTALNPGPEVVALGVVVDLLHAASMFAFAAVVPDLRDAELADALAATALAVAEPAMSSLGRPRTVGRDQQPEDAGTARPPPPARLLAIRTRRRPVTVWVGTSGWSYDHWEPELYPQGLPARDRLPRYVAAFPTAELNSSFYRWPSPAQFSSWRRRLPDGFRLSVKAPRGLTHARKLLAPESWIDRIGAGWHELDGRRAVLLVQLAPSHARDDARLDYFLRLLPGWIRVAVEFRHPSWHCEEIFALLAEHAAAYCVMSGADLPCILRATTDFVLRPDARPRPASPVRGRVQRRRPHVVGRPRKGMDRGRAGRLRLLQQ